MLVLCEICQRHIKAQSTACPFCAEPAQQVASKRPPPKRVGRAVMMAGASAVTMAASCSTAQPAYGTCPMPMQEVEITSLCGFASVTTTTCSGSITFPNEQSCKVGPITASCTVNVTLGDGTEHTIAVTFGSEQPGGFCGNQTFTGVTSSNPVVFSTATCSGLRDAGPDVADARSDAPGTDGD